MTESPGTMLVYLVVALVIYGWWQSKKADRAGDMAAGRTTPRSTKDHIAVARVRSFTEMYLRAGYEDGVSLRPNSRMMVRLAPAERPRGALAFATPGGPDVHYSADTVAQVRAWSRAGTIIGFGGAGFAAAGVANAISKHTAGWELEIRFQDGNFLHLYTDTGAPPATELARLRARLAGAA